MTIAALSDISGNDTDIRAMREAVAALCAGFGAEYWRALDRERGYPTAFVEEMTRSGFLGCLIPLINGTLGYVVSRNWVFKDA